jgi:hypothetical protein
VPDSERSPIYWERMEDMKADVEPFPFVPAMCMRFNRLNSSGFNKGQLIVLIHSLSSVPDIRSSESTQSFQGSPVDSYPCQICVSRPPPRNWTAGYLEQLPHPTDCQLLHGGEERRSVLHRFAPYCSVLWRKAALLSECKTPWVSILKACS